MLPAPSVFIILDSHFFEFHFFPLYWATYFYKKFIFSLLLKDEIII
jgi:hypothetical protein